MRLTLLLVVAAVVLMPMAAFADCSADVARIYDDAKPEERVKLDSPRAKALFSKSKSLMVKLNEKDCQDTITGLHQLMGRSN